jgi:hypothetical protein
MTTRANLLTAGATRAPSDGGPKWSMPANSVRALVNALARLGYDSGSLPASAGLDDHDLDNPDARISCERVGALLSRAQQQRFTPNLGLEIARVTPLGAYPLLDYLVVTSDTAGEGIRQFARYCRLVGNPVTVDVREDVDPIRVVFSDAAAPFIYAMRPTAGSPPRASVSSTNRTIPPLWNAP